MKTRAWRHRVLLGYVALVLIAVLALELHTRHVDARLSAVDHRSCEQRTVLAQNQVFVLRTLRLVALAEYHEDVHSIFRSRLFASAGEAERRIAELNPTRPC